MILRAPSDPSQQVKSVLGIVYSSLFDLIGKSKCSMCARRSHECARSCSSLGIYFDHHEEMEEVSTPISTSSPSSSSISTPLRLWRPAAQRNLRNQWSRLFAAKIRWAAVVASGRSSATALVNAYLSRRYLPNMDLGVLKDMPGIISRASDKLSRQQELSRISLLSSYKKMVDVVSEMIKASASMRCFLSCSGNSSLIQFSDSSDDKNDMGDGGGIPVFSSWSIESFELVGEEIVKMFVSDLFFKRLLVLGLLGISSQDASGEEMETLHWPSELYLGEHDNLIGSPLLLLKDKYRSFLDEIKDWESNIKNHKHIDQHSEREVFQVYLTAWISNVNLDMNRVEDIFHMVEEVMQVKLS